MKQAGEVMSIRTDASDARGEHHPAPAGAPLALADRLAVTTGDSVVLLGRIAMGLIFVESGFGKLINLAGFAESLASKGLPAASLLALIGAVVEFAGGIAVILGLATRYAAVLTAGFVVAATLISHRFWEFEGAAYQMQYIQFGKNLAILGGFLVLFAAGAGRFSLDRLLGRSGGPG
jgi:putative oxidoreductase